MLEPLLEKWKSFGWHAQEINGHNFAEIKDSLDTNSVNDKPSVIIANTIRGRISFMEDNNNWHYKIPNEEELSMALSELTKNKNKISFKKIVFLMLRDILWKIKYRIQN